MILFILAAAFIAIGIVFFWFNTNSPLQTPIPAIAFPVGAALALIQVGRMLS